jgi:hypothetical protein
MLVLIARRTSNPGYAEALAIAELISDAEKRDTLATGLFRRWHEKAPEHALKWLRGCEWSAERIARVNRRIHRL